MPSKKGKYKSLKIIGILIGVIYFVSGLILLREHTNVQYPAPVFRGWLLYSDGPYKGKVIDAETGASIEGAVVAGSWYLEVFPGWPKFCDAVETTTDKNGEFVLPRAWCIKLWPIAQLSSPGEVIVFKPGYLGYPPLGNNEEERRNYMPDWGNPQLFEYKRQFNIVKLGRPKTREERELTYVDTGFSDDETRKKLPGLLRLMNEERKNLGLPGEER